MFDSWSRGIVLENWTVDRKSGIDLAVWATIGYLSGWIITGGLRESGGAGGASRIARFAD